MPLQISQNPSSSALGGTTGSKVFNFGSNGFNPSFSMVAIIGVVVLGGIAITIIKGSR